MQQNTQKRANRCAGNGQNDILTEDIGVHLAVIKAQDLDGGDLAHPLRNIDVSQVVQYHKRQKACRDNQDKHDQVQPVKRIVKGLYQIGGEGKAHNLFILQKRLCQTILCLVGRVGKPGIYQLVGGLFSERLTISRRRQINVMIHIIFSNSGDFHFARRIVSRCNRQRITHGERELGRHFFCDNGAPVR